MSTQLQAVQHIRRMRGGSQSHLVRASDGNYYVTKFQNNPQHIRVLVNEMFATRLGQWLGLPMPQVEVIEVSGWLIENTPELRVQIGASSVPCRSGRQLGSKFLCDPLTATFYYLPESALMKVVNLSDFARVLVLDKWTANSDGRQAIFSRRNGCSHYRATFIDQGYCFNAGEWSFIDSPLRGAFANPRIYERVLNWDSFEPALSKAEGVEHSDLRRCAEGIPQEWYEGDQEALERMVDSLFRRRGFIRDLIEEFRCSSRNPFPNWTEPTSPR